MCCNTTHTNIEDCKSPVTCVSSDCDKIGTHVLDDKDVTIKEADLYLLDFNKVTVNS